MRVAYPMNFFSDNNKLRSFISGAASDRVHTGIMIVTYICMYVIIVITTSMIIVITTFWGCIACDPLVIMIITICSEY